MTCKEAREFIELLYRCNFDGDDCMLPCGTMYQHRHEQCNKERCGINHASRCIECAKYFGIRSGKFADAAHVANRIVFHLLGPRRGATNPSGN